MVCFSCFVTNLDIFGPTEQEFCIHNKQTEHRYTNVING